MIAWVTMEFRLWMIGMDGNQSLGHDGYDWFNEPRFPLELASALKLWFLGLDLLRVWVGCSISNRVDPFGPPSTPTTLRPFNAYAPTPFTFNPPVTHPGPKPIFPPKLDPNFTLFLPFPTDQIFFFFPFLQHASNCIAVSQHFVFLRQQTYNSQEFAFLHLLPRSFTTSSRHSFVKTQKLNSPITA